MRILPRAPRKRPTLAFIAWSSVQGRSVEIAAALDGEARCFHSSMLDSRRLIAFRYVLCAARTLGYLLLRRPRAVIVSNPPIFPGVIAFLYGAVSGAPVVLDSHPSSFALYPGKRLIAAMMPVHRFLMSRVRGVTVTVDELAQRVVEQGGRAEIVHEAPPLWRVRPAHALDARARVLFVGIFAEDEPTELVVEAARRLPEVDLEITGDLRRCPPALLASSPQNVRFTGFLGPEDYREAIERANVVVALTDRPEDVSRAASEAVFAGRPLVTSDTAAAKRYFPFAVHVPNTIGGIADGISQAVRRYRELCQLAEPALEAQLQRCEEQLDRLQALVAAD